MTDKERAEQAYEALFRQWDEREEAYAKAQAERHGPEPSVFQQFLSAAGRLTPREGDRPFFVKDEKGRVVRITPHTFDPK